MPRIQLETASRLKRGTEAEDVVVVEDAGHLVLYDQPNAGSSRWDFWLGKTLVKGGIVDDCVYHEVFRCRKLTDLETKKKKFSISKE